MINGSYQFRKQAGILLKDRIFKERSPGHLGILISTHGAGADIIPKVLSKVLSMSVRYTICAIVQ